MPLQAFDPCRMGNDLMSIGADRPAYRIVDGVPKRRYERERRYIHVLSKRGDKECSRPDQGKNEYTKIPEFQKRLGIGPGKGRDDEEYNPEEERKPFEVAGCQECDDSFFGHILIICDRLRIMKYVALLRGINVGGKTLIKMADLKAAIEDAGFSDVTTLIASGNVIFSSPERHQAKIEDTLEKVIHARFKLPVRVLVYSKDQMEHVIGDVPRGWNTRKDIRMYVAFLKAPTTPSQVVSQMKPKEGIDEITPGPSVVYMATLMSGLTKSNINKIIGTKIYGNMTMRNYNTTKKIFHLLEAD